MIVYPAIDVKGGQVVRLRQGDPRQSTTYSDHPIEVALRWQSAGAEWIHLVNLDGALYQSRELADTLREIVRMGISIQYGGGLRSREDIARALDCGIHRAVIGTMAVENPETVAELVREYGAESLVIALDARKGKVLTHGWQAESAWTAIELGRYLAQAGIRHALYTDILRDGELTGVNIDATIRLADETNLKVIASGGVHHLTDVQALAASRKVAGVVLGKALYEGHIRLEEALEAARLSPSQS